MERHFMPYEYQEYADELITFRPSYSYERSFHDYKIANCLFGDSTISLLGSNVNDGTGLLADYFGLGPDAEGSFSVSPRIQMNTLDLDLRINFETLAGCYLAGWYLWMYVPISAAQWDLNLDTQLTVTAPVPTFNAGYMGTIAQGDISPTTKVAAALSGDFLFGTMQTPWAFARFDQPCPQWQVKVADVALETGVELQRCINAHVNIYARMVIPTGTKIDAQYARSLFTPVIGNGHHGELGAGIDAHCRLWNWNICKTLDAEFNGRITHLFTNRQIRTFDFDGHGCMSRYMLLKEYEHNAAGGYSATGNLISGVNFSTRAVDVTVRVKGEAAFRLVYRNQWWTSALGYRLYGRMPETLSQISQTACAAPAPGYGFKGCAGVQTKGYTIPANTTDIDPSLTTAVYTLSSSESNATIVSCGNVDNARALYTPATISTAGGVYVDPTDYDVTIINAPMAVGLLPIALESSSTTPNARIPVTGITPDPVLISNNVAPFNRCTGQVPTQVSQTLFFDLQYRWSDCTYIPSLGVNAMAEFSTQGYACSLNRWGLTLVATVSW